MKTKSFALDIYLSLLGAMLAGRITNGILSALIFKAGSYSFELWISTAFVTALPGVVIQIVLIPIIMLALRKSKIAQ